jgi:dihydrodipicolinate synthase/N-acetylneuraminate lyase
MTTSAAPSGIYSAQWIPTDVNGRIDRASLDAHPDFERRAGISGVLALGSTGEFPFFTVDERKRPQRPRRCRRSSPPSSS